MCVYAYGAGSNKTSSTSTLQNCDKHGKQPQPILRLGGKGVHGHGGVRRIQWTHGDKVGSYKSNWQGAALVTSSPASVAVYSLQRKSCTQPGDDVKAACSVAWNTQELANVDASLVSQFASGGAPTDCMAVSPRDSTVVATSHGGTVTLWSAAQIIGQTQCGESPGSHIQHLVFIRTDSNQTGQVHQEIFLFLFDFFEEIGYQKTSW